MNCRVNGLWLCAILCFSAGQISDASEHHESAADRFADTSVGAGELDEQLTAAGWVLLTKQGTPATKFSHCDQEQICVVSDGGNALIYRAVDAAVTATSELTWEWRVNDLRRGVAADENADPDWPVVVYAAFAVDKKHIGWFRRLVNRFKFSLAGLPESGNILSYVYSADKFSAEPGMFVPNPYIPKIGRLTVLRSAEEENATSQAGWLLERRNLLADFETAFGYPATKVVYLAISADSEDTASASVARVRNLQLR